MDFQPNDAISNFKKMLEYQLKENIAEAIISEEMALLEQKIRLRVKELIEPFTIDQICRFKDTLRLCDNYEVTLRWPED